MFVLVLGGNYKSHADSSSRHRQHLSVDFSSQFVFVTDTLVIIGWETAVVCDCWAGSFNSEDRTFVA
jgi:hypothetical protein